MSRIPINDNDADLRESAGASNAEPEQRADQGGPASGADGQRNDLEGLRAERDSLYERLARVSAEFKNSQRRMQTDTDQRLQYANSSLIKSLLPVIDNFERALNVDPDKTDGRSLLKGMQIVHDQLMSVLKQQQVEEIAPQAGTPFDPSMHEALMQQEATYSTPTVTQLMQKGYSMHGRTLRPAQVAVSKSV
jgi:molecular chaperone GrpE